MECTPEEKRERGDILQELKIAVFGNGNKENSLVSKMNKMEKFFGGFQVQLAVIEVLLGVLILASIPELIKFLG